MAKYLKQVTCSRTAAWWFMNICWIEHHKTCTLLIPGIKIQVLIIYRLLQAIKQFIDLLNSSTQQHPVNKKQISSATALQYLCARKFDISKAVALYEANHSTRQREGLYGFNPFVDPLHTELETGKFTILVSTNWYFLSTKLIARTISQNAN